MEHLKLWENGTPYYDPSFGQEEPFLEFFPCEAPGKHSCFIVCPGGGYEFLAEPEGNPIAHQLNIMGFSALVLNYRIAPYHSPAMIADVTRAVRYARYHADKLNISPEHIGIIGFSAGGHAAITALEHFDEGAVCGDEIDSMSARPDIGVLCYPVVSLGETTHKGTCINFAGDRINDPDFIKKYSGECSVRADMPPVFVWHDIDDPTVPVRNSVDLAKALTEASIPYELHIFPSGKHGISLARHISGAGQWIRLLGVWLDRMKFYPTII